MTFMKKPQDKTEFELIKEEVSAAVQREQAAAAQDAKQEADCRLRYDAAKQEQNAALESGNMDQYRNAGLAAESARLELEFCEKRRKAGRKPVANRDDDQRICRAISTEEKRVKEEVLTRLMGIFTEAVNVCRKAGHEFNEINSLYASWKNTVMKDNDLYTHTMAEGSINNITAIENDLNVNIEQIKNLKGM